MKLITAKFNSKCAETGAPIKKGQQMLYDYSTKKCYSTTSNTAKKQEENREAESIKSYIEAQENAYFDKFNY